MLTRNYLRSLICRIDVSAFAGVMFALVWLMMAPAVVVICGDRSALDLPHTDSAYDQKRADREDAMVLAVQRDGTVYFQSQRTIPAKLPAMIRKQVSSGSDRKVYVRADARASYGSVLRALDGVRSSGVIDQIAFVTELRRAKQQTP